MAEADPTKSIVSKGGHVLLPQAIMDQRHWGEGTQLTFEDTPDGVLVKGEPLFAPTTVDEVFGMLKYDGPPISIEEMDENILREARRRYRNGEY